MARARETAGVRAAFKVVDTCGGEFEARTPYFYSTYDPDDEARPLPQNLARLNLARAFLVDGTTILHADRKFLLAALPPAR